jgi:hypothetical protein
MEALEYITKDGLLQCSEGSAPGIFTPTYNTTVKINGCVAATKIDMAPITNVPSFVICKKTQKTCTPVTTPWQDTYPVKVKGQETLIGKSCITCGVGGKIEFIMSGQIPLDADEKAQLQAARDDVQKAHDEEMEEKNKPWWQKAGEFIVDCIPVVGPVVSLVKNVSKGNWGMALLDVGFLALDVASIVAAPFTGGASVAGATVAKAGIRQAVKAGVKQVAKKLSKEALEAAAKQTAEMLSKLSVKSLTRGRLCVFACFPAGTPVATKNGLKNIEEIEMGDEVWAYDENINLEVLEEVLYVFNSESTTFFEIELTNGEIIVVTPDHEFWVEGLVTNEYRILNFNYHQNDINNDVLSKTWTKASELKPGNSLKAKNNFIYSIKSINVIVRNIEPVFNVCVSSNHNYFVGQSNILSHNKICYKSVFFAANPLLKGKVVVHHAVEQQVKKRYPGLFTDAELHALSNLRGIPKGINGRLHLSLIRKQWNKFYKKFPNPTKDQITKFAERLDSKLGKFFDPPM